MEHSELMILAGVIGLGVFCQWLAWKWRIPAIIPLLAAGFTLGPILGWLHPQDLLGDLFFPVVSLSVALILFEGALTLEFREVRHVRRTVRNLITIGALITWWISAAAAYWLVDLSWPLAILFGALIMVTGPTVIGPLLRNIRPTAQVASVLKWEGILIDPIGALVALVVFDIIVAEGPAGVWGLPALWTLLRIIAVGLSIGAAAGWLTSLSLKRYWTPDYLRDLTVLVAVLLTFAISDLLQSEAGLLAVTVMGVWLANAGLRQLHEVWHFKERISILLISTLFIVLAANISRTDLALLTWSSLALLLVVIFVARPLSVWVSTLGSGLNKQERLFLGWVAPRGIVAASVSSLFAFRLQEMGYEEGRLLAALTFLIIVGTVLIHGSTAKWWARRLGVAEAEPQGFLLLGATPFAHALAKVLNRHDFRTLLVDSNRHLVNLAQMQGLEAFHGNLLSAVVQDEINLSGIGRLMALTSNDEANALACGQFQMVFGSEEVYQLPPDIRDIRQGEPAYAAGHMGRTLFGNQATFDWIDDLMHHGAQVKATPLTEEFPYEAYQAQWGDRARLLLAFRGAQVVINTVDAPLQPRPGWKLVALIADD